MCIILTSRLRYSTGNSAIPRAEGRSQEGPKESKPGRSLGPDSSSRDIIEVA